MRNLSLISAIIVVVAVLGAGCTQSQQAQSSQPAATSPPVPEQTASLRLTTPASTPISQVPVSANTIAIKNFAFVPQTITVNAGSIVRWENHDSVPHRIVFIDRNGRDTDVGSMVLSLSQSYSNKFDKPGTYNYYCKIHPEMTGTVIVE